MMNVADFNAHLTTASPRWIIHHIHLAKTCSIVVKKTTCLMIHEADPLHHSNFLRNGERRSLHSLGFETQRQRLWLGKVKLLQKRIVCVLYLTMKVLVPAWKCSCSRTGLPLMHPCCFTVYCNRWLGRNTIQVHRRLLSMGQNSHSPAVFLKGVHVWL